MTPTYEYQVQESTDAGETWTGSIYDIYHVYWRAYDVYLDKQDKLTSKIKKGVTIPLEASQEQIQALVNSVKNRRYRIAKRVVGEWYLADD